MKPDSAHATALSPSPNFGDRRGKTIDALILHYTGMRSGAAAFAWLRDPASGVSCHYLVWEDGRITQLVAERDRAWHAGRSFWCGETDMNAVSIGVEIVNTGHDGGCPPYPAAQIAAVVALCGDICARNAIAPRRVLAHSDIAPDRKIDPGEWFPWDKLAAAGVGLHVTPGPPGDDLVLGPGDSGPAVAALQADLAALGFDAPRTGCYCALTQTIVAAFQRHHRPELVDGNADPATRATLAAILQVPV